MTYFIMLMFLLIPVTGYALDKKIGAVNCFKILVSDTVGNGIAGLDVVSPFNDFNIQIQCGANTVVTVNETNDTVTDESGGVYYVCTDDIINNAPEEECLAWFVGQGIYSPATGNLIAKTPVKFKAVNDTASATVCDISASTSGVSFTVATCKDEDGNAVTLSTDMFVGSYMVAYTNGSAQCNVVGHGVFVGDVTSGGVVTVKDSDLPGSGFPATPNTANCGVRISP